ncbi:MAG: rhodanese-like domain-containing protein [Candidatus Binatia bacterium]
MKHAPGFLKIVNEARTRIREVSVDDVQTALEAGERFVLIDTREESEWARGHLPDAVHLSKGILERDVEAAYPDLNTPLVLYCGGGFRSALAADSLQKMGYRNVRSMDGGWREWTEKGLPVEKN